MTTNEPPFKKSKKENDADSSGTVKKILDDINRCQAQIENLNEKASEEILQIEQKYNKMRKPVFQQRNEHFKKLPKFWGITLSNHPNVGSIIQEEEKDCLNYIIDCVAEEFEDIKLGYKISFSFKENPYLENEVITKTIHMASSANARSESTSIKWKRDKNLIKKYSTLISNQSQRRRHIPATFFSWFTDNSRASSDQVAETIKEDLWPTALQYYLATGFGKENGTEHEESDGDDAESDEESESESDKEAKDDTEDPIIILGEDSVAEAELEGALPEGDGESPEISDFDQDEDSEDHECELKEKKKHMISDKQKTSDIGVLENGSKCEKLNMKTESGEKT